MSGKHVASLFFSYLGLFFWSFQLAPQCWSNWRSKATGNLSLLMLFLWVLWSPFFFGYGLYKKLITPFLIQPNLFGFFGIVAYAQVLYYRNAPPDRSSIRFGATIITGLILLGVGDVVCYYISYESHKSSHHGAHWIPVFMGIIPTILIPVGFAPQFWATYRDKGCRGVSPYFVVGDMLGSLFSLIGLLLDYTVDYLSLGTFIATLFLDICLLLAVLITMHVDKRNGGPPGSRTNPTDTDDNQSINGSDNASNNDNVITIDVVDDCTKLPDDSKQSDNRGTEVTTDINRTIVTVDTMTPQEKTALGNLDIVDTPTDGFEASQKYEFIPEKTIVQTSTIETPESLSDVEVGFVSPTIVNNAIVTLSVATQEDPNEPELDEKSTHNSINSNQ